MLYTPDELNIVYFHLTYSLKVNFYTGFARIITKYSLRRDRGNHKDSELRRNRYHKPISTIFPNANFT